MAQHDYTIANQGFPATRADINNALSAIATNNSGTSAPSTQYAGQFWIDTTTTTWTLYIHDGTDDIQFATIDTSANTVNFTDSALDVVTDTTPQLGGNLDLNSNDITGTGNINITGTGTFSGDLTVDTNTLYVDSTNNRVGIGTASPTSKLQVEGSTTINSTATPPLTIHHTDGNIVALGFQCNASDNHSLMFTDTDFRINYDGSEKMRIDSSGLVGIGTSSPDGKLDISAPQTTSDKFTSPHLALTSSSQSNSDGFCGISYSSATITNYGWTVGSTRSSGGDGSSHFTFRYHYNSASGTERMRIDSSGNVLVGKTSANSAVPGIEFRQTDIAMFTRDSDTPVLINRTTNDGILVEFEAQNTLEGTITVSGATVSYNGFTGTHWSRFTDNSTPNILRGTVLESLDEMCDWYNLEFDVTTTKQDENGNDVTETHTEKVSYVLADGQSNGDIITYNHEGTDYQATIVKETDIKHVKSKVSDTVDAKNVYGVFVAYDEDGEGYNDFYVASVGSFVVRIKQGETVAKGDLLQSNGDGTAKVQTDDAVRSSSFAKVLSTTIIETYEDGSYLVPCSLMC